MRAGRAYVLRRPPQVRAFARITFDDQRAAFFFNGANEIRPWNNSIPLFHGTGQKTLLASLPIRDCGQKRKGYESRDCHERDKHKQTYYWTMFPWSLSLWAKDRDCFVAHTHMISVLGAPGTEFGRPQLISFLCGELR